MKWHGFFLGLLSILLIILMVFYLAFPNQNVEFSFNDNNNFSLDGNNASMQFYSNMRFPYSEISYMIEEDCTLQKKGEMIRAFEIVSNSTDLSFYEDFVNPEILIGCSDKNKLEDGMFIAGEGGPTKIVPGEIFNVILFGNILLIRDSNCERPNVAIHELLHVLGFNHSENSNNIMYPVSKCKQTIGEEIPLEINRLYSTPSLPDLKFEEVLANVKGRSLDINMSVKNGGLVSSKMAKIVLYGDGKEIKEIELDPLKIGYEVKISLSNVWITKLKIEELLVSLEYNYTELSKENNQISLTKINNN